MSGNLLDTNVVLFTLTDDPRLSPTIRSAVAAGPNLLSVVSYWEVLIKSMKGGLDVGDPRIWWARALEHLVAVPLTVRPEHIAGIYTLPPIHKDPFDRLLIAQASVESCTFVTTDSDIPRYVSDNLRVVV